MSTFSNWIPAFAGMTMWNYIVPRRISEDKVVDINYNA